MLKKDLTHQITNAIDHCLLEKTKKNDWINENELGEKIMTEFVTPRQKTYSYFTDDDSEVKIAKRTKKCIIKKHLSLIFIKIAY